MDNNLHQISNNIDKKLSRLANFADKKNLNRNERNRLLNEGFEKSCALYGITQEQYVEIQITKS